MNWNAPEAAIVCARKAVAWAPTDVNAVKNLGAMLYRVERHGEARVWLEEAYAMAPKAWSTAINLPLLEYATGDLQHSEELFIEAVAVRTPRRSATASGRGDAYLRCHWS